MRVLLAMLARRGRERYLDQILAVLTPSFDGVEIRYDEGEGIRDFAGARNELVKAGERQGFDWIFMLDADECIFPGDVLRLRGLIEQSPYGFIVMPRINLAKDPAHFVPMFYPDYQARLFRLRSGYHYRHAVHESVYRGLRPWTELRSGNFLISGATPIYHYGLMDDPEQVVLRSLNYDRIAQGLPILSELSDEEYGENADRFLWPLAEDRLQALGLPHPLGVAYDPSYQVGWAAFYLRRATPAEEASVLGEHADLLARVEESGGPVLEVGSGSGILGRQLALRGLDVTSVDRDEAVVRRAVEAGIRTGIRVEKCDALDLDARFEPGSFHVAFSEGLFQYFDDDEARRALEQQLRVAEKAFISVPVDRTVQPEASYGGERYRSTAEWLALLEPVAKLRASLYGHRYLPLKSALFAAARGRLREAERNIVIEATPEG